MLRPPLLNITYHLRRTEEFWVHFHVNNSCLLATANLHLILTFPPETEQKERLFNKQSFSILYPPDDVVFGLFLRYIAKGNPICYPSVTRGDVCVFRMYVNDATKIIEYQDSIFNL